MSSRSVPFKHFAASLSLLALLGSMSVASAQQPQLGKGALFQASRQVAADQARQVEGSVAPPLRQAPSVAPSGMAPVLRELQAGGPNRDAQDSPFGTGYERRMERAAAAAGLADGTPARPAAAGAAAGGAGAAAGAQVGGQGSGRGRR